MGTEPTIPDRADLRTLLAEHPWRTVALVFAAGACFGLIEPRGRFARMLAGTFASAVLVFVRDALGRGLVVGAPA